MKRVLFAVLATTAMGVATVAQADCGCSAPLAAAPVTTAYYAPSVMPSTTASVVTGSPMPSTVTTAYYAPMTTVAEPVTTTAYYAPVTTYYAPAPVTAYYAPAPVTTYYAPAPVSAYYAPTYYAPAYAAPVYYRGLFGRPRVAY